MSGIADSASPPVSDGEDIEKLLDAYRDTLFAFAGYGDNPRRDWTFDEQQQEETRARKAIADALSQSHQLRIAAEQERDEWRTRALAVEEQLGREAAIRHDLLTRLCLLGSKLTLMEKRREDLSTREPMVDAGEGVGPEVGPGPHGDP